MFAPKAAKPQNKAAACQTSRLQPEPSRLATCGLGHDAAEQAQFIQETIENQTAPQLLMQQPSRADRGIGPGSMKIPMERRGPSRDFSGIPVSPPGRASQSRSPFSPRSARFEGAIQTKLAVGSVDDPLEAEADRVADRMVKKPHPGISTPDAAPQVSQTGSDGQALVQSAASPTMQHARRTSPDLDQDCRTEENGAVQRNAAGRLSGVMAPQSVHRVLGQSGHPLDAATRAYMEPRFGFDFSRVRIHADAEAAQSASEVQALAYTVDHSIVFSAGSYQPQTSPGRLLLAHELTHVIQQNGASQRSPLLQRQPVTVTERLHPEESGAFRGSFKVDESGNVFRYEVELNDVSPLMLSQDKRPDIAREVEEGIGEVLQEHLKLKESLNDLDTLHLTLSVGISQSIKPGHVRHMVSSAARPQIGRLIAARNQRAEEQRKADEQKKLATEQRQRAEARAKAEADQRAASRQAEINARVASNSLWAQHKILEKGIMEWRAEGTGDLPKFHVRFTPFSAFRSGTVTFLQTVQTTKTDAAAADPGESPKLDFRDEENDPFYGAVWDDQAHRWNAEDMNEETRTSPATANEPIAYLFDQPKLFKGMQRMFETVAVVPETGETLGALRWGVAIGRLYHAQPSDCTDDPSPAFAAAVERFYAKPATVGPAQRGPQGREEGYDAIIDGFAANDASLGAKQQKDLDPILRKLASDTDAVLWIGGFADATEKDPAGIAKARAQAVEKFVRDNASRKVRIATEAFGASWARYSPAPGETRNRRVQCYLELLPK